MIIIADSGSTKTDWKIVDGYKVTAINTIGFNPVLTNTELIINELQKSFSKNILNKKVSAVYYYGAGCWNKETCLVVKKALLTLFPNAKIEVTNDLLGAARAVCGKSPGIACILGTGANSCLYDGKEVIDNVTALGYIIGDEGSGAYLGKRLMQSYFYREIPVLLKAKLDNYYDVSKKNILDNVYGKKNGNKYLAAYAKFIIAEKNHPFIEKIITDAFDIFIKRQVLKYKNVKDLPINFIGSIAFFLKDILKERIEKNNLTFGNIIRQPIDGLVEYHLQKDCNYYSGQ